MGFYKLNKLAYRGHENLIELMIQQKQYHGLFY